MSLLDEIYDQVPGIDDNWGPGRKRLPLPLMDQINDAPATEYAANVGAGAGAAGGIAGDLDTGRLSHRIADDQQTGNRSGGPAGNYQDPGAGRLAKLMSQREAMDVPPPKPKLWKQMLGVGMRLAPVLGAYALGGAGATEGAEAGVEAGVARRQQQQDLAGQRREAEKIRLSQEIDAEARAGEQRTFQHGEDVLRQQTTEAGINERARQAQTAETGRNERLAKSIESREGMQQSGFGQQFDMEDRKQQGRMELQMAKADAQMAVKRFQAAHPNQNLPPVLTKAFGTYETSQSRMDTMESAYKRAMQDPENQQAQLLLLSSHLGMTMGLQPGARMNQAIINEAQRSGLLTERIEAHFGPDGYMTGVVLSPRQMTQMMELAQTRLLEDARAVKETEAYIGRSGAAPIAPRVPGQQGGPGTAGGAGGAGATAAATPADIPKPPGPPHPGMQWQYSPSRKQFRQVPIIATK